MSDGWTERCPGCGEDHGDWTDEGTARNSNGRGTMLDLWRCDRCGYMVDGVRL